MAEEKKETIKKETPRKESETITIKRETLWKSATFVLLAVVVIQSFFLFGDGIKTPTANVVAAEPSPSPSPAPARAELKIEEGDHVLGDPKAKVVIIEYSDVQCPFCGRFYEDALAQMKAQYIGKKDVAFAFRHFPLTSIHPEAMPGALATECAAEQGKFWEMHDKIFENQAIMSASNYKLWAGELGLNTNQFNDCFDSGKYNTKIQEQMSGGQALGVRGTPASYINGISISGAQPFSSFQSVVESELAK